MKAGLLIILFPFLAWASGSISFSAVEAEYSYKVKFRSMLKAEKFVSALGIFPNAVNSTKLAEEHAAHIFGLFHSPNYMDKLGYPAELSVGFAGTKQPDVSNVEVSTVKGDPYLWIEYQAEGETLLHTKTAELWFKGSDTAKVSLPFFTNFPLVYTDKMVEYTDSKFKRCTDEHYWQPKEFPYFWDPYICPELAEAPISTLVEFEFHKLEEPQGHTVPLQKIRGDNENGPLTVLYFAHGFDEVPPSRTDKPSQKLYRDAGYKLYKGLNETLTKKYGFKRVSGIKEFREVMGDDLKYINLIREVSLEDHRQRRYFSTLVRKDRDGKIWVVRSGLFPSDNDEELVTFPTFWKEAWENGDFIYYGGHSGDGTSLSINNMLSNIKKSQKNITENIEFSQTKTQIAYFDACSTYDHFQDMYAGLKPQNLHMLTYGLVSLFEVAAATEEAMLDFVINQKEELTWKEQVEKIEASQLMPYLEFLFDNKSVRTRKFNYYSERKLYPTSLLNVFITGD